MQHRDRADHDHRRDEELAKDRSLQQPPPRLTHVLRVGAPRLLAVAFREKEERGEKGHHGHDRRAVRNPRQVVGVRPRQQAA